MRRVTSFCVLVASILILIQGARSEHAFRQNDRLPNAIERDADKYNRPQVSTKLPINPQDQVDACPIKANALVESVQTIEKGTDSSTVPPSCTRRVVRQNSARRNRRMDTGTRNVVRQSTASRHRRMDIYTRDVVKQSTARTHRRRDIDTTDVVRQSTARTHRRRDIATRDVVRQSTVRTHRRRDTDTRGVVRQSTARTHRRRDIDTRDVVRQSTASRHRRRDSGTRDAVRLARRHMRRDSSNRDVVRQNTGSRQLRRDAESRRVRRTLSSDSRRNIRLTYEVHVKSRSTVHRNDERKRNNIISSGDFRNTRRARYTKRTIRDSRRDIRVSTLPYQHNGNVNLHHVDTMYTTNQENKHDIMQSTGSSTQGRSASHGRREVQHSRRNRNSSRRQVSIETRRQAVPGISLSAASRLPVNARGRRTDVRRRLRHSTRRASKNIRLDVIQKFESVRISIPRDFHTVSVIGQFTMQASKGRYRQSSHLRSDRRVVRRARQTRGYRRISSSTGFKKTNEVVFLRELIDDVDSRGMHVENVEKSSNDRQYEMTPSEIKEQSSLDLVDVSAGDSVNIHNNSPQASSANGNRVIFRQGSQNHRRRVEKRRRVSSVENKSRRSNGVRINHRARQTVMLRNTRIVMHREGTVQRRNRRAARRHLNSTQSRSQRFMRTSNNETTRRYVRIAGNQRKAVSEASRVNRKTHVQHRERSTRGIHRLRVARAAEDMHSRERKIMDYRSIPGDTHHPSASRHQARGTRHITTYYGSLRQETPMQTRIQSRRNSRMRRRRGREVRSRLGRRGVVDRRISQYDSNSHNIQGPQNSLMNFDLPVTDFSSTKSRAVVRGMTGSRRVNRHSVRRRSLPLHSPKALIVTTKSRDGQHPDIADGSDATVDQSWISISTQHASAKLSGSLDYFLTYLLSCVKDFQSSQPSDSGILPGDTTQGTDSCARGVMLGVVALLSTTIVQKVSAPSLSFGRIRQGLLA